MLKIRLRRTGKKRTPYYRVVVAEKEAKRDGAFLETLGSYDPHANPPSAVIDADKTREWIRKGAQPSEAAVKVLRRVGILEAAPRTEAKVAPEGGKAKGKDGSKAAARAAAPAAAAKAEAPAAAAAAEVEVEADVEAPAAEAPAAEVVAEAKAAPEAGEPATEDVMEAAVEGTPVAEQQEPGDDSAAEEAPTAE